MTWTYKQLNDVHWFDVVRKVEDRVINDSKLLELTPNEAAVLVEATDRYLRDVTNESLAQVGSAMVSAENSRYHTRVNALMKIRTYAYNRMSDPE